MNSNYRLERTDIMDALSDIDKFKVRMDKFVTKYPAYSYSVDITEDNINAPDKWVVLITIQKDEQPISKDI